MANTIAHLVVAKKLLELYPDLVSDLHAYYLGNLAPDTIGSKPGASRREKMLVHLRGGISDLVWLEPQEMKVFDERVVEFANKHINAEGLSQKQRDFNIGYLAHLLTDKCNHGTIRQWMLKIAKSLGFKEGTPDFYMMMVNDLEALDSYLLDTNPGLAELFDELTAVPVDCALEGFIEEEYIQSSIGFWKNRYLPGIKQRKVLYCELADIDKFVEAAVKAVPEQMLPLINSPKI